MRIAFTGAAGTGKTTLAKFVAEITGLPFNPVGARSVAKAMGFVEHGEGAPYKADAAGRRGDLQRRLITEKIAWENAHADGFVTDRTPFDNVAYTALHEVVSVDSIMLLGASQGARSYTHVIYCPMDAFFNLGGDPARWPATTYHELFETFVVALMKRRGMDRDARWLEMKSGDLEERQAEVLRFLGGWTCNTCGVIDDSIQERLGDANPVGSCGHVGHTQRPFGVGSKWS